MKRLFRTLTLLASLSLLALPLVACDDGDTTKDPVVTTGTVELTVNDLCHAGAGLEGAVVDFNGTVYTATADGKIAIADLGAGELSLTVTKAGYLPVDVMVTVTAGAQADKSADLTCQSLAVADMARTFLEGLNADGAYTPVTKAQGLFDNLNDGDTSNDPAVISVRSAEHYALGHVPGAINIPWKTVADDASLALLGEPNSGKLFVDYCYTGHTGGIAAGVLNLLGYPTANMKYGFASWTTDETARAGAVEPVLTGDFPIETTINTPTATFDAPWMEYDVDTAWEATQAAAQAYLANADMKPTINAQEVFDNLNDGDTSNDPFIISVRAPADYAFGHIPGAVNMPYKEIAKAENLALIPTDRDLVIYCYTGHTGAVATAVLGTLGYHRVKNMKFGFAAYTQDATARAQSVFDPATDAHDFPFVTGTEPGTMP